MYDWGGGGLQATGTAGYDQEDLASLGFDLTAAEMAALQALKSPKCWS